MQPRHPRAWTPLLLCAALGLIACDPLKLNPDPPPPVEEEPPPLELQVTVATEGPAFCREGTWMLSVSVAGGTPERVELSTNGQPPMKLDSPYRYSVDCATADEGSYSFVARARAEGRTFESASASVVVDRTAPRIASWRPKTFYPTVDTPVEVVFSEPLLPESLQASPTLLRDGNGFSVPHQTVLTEEGRVLRLVPSAPLQPPVTLYLELVQRSMTDRAGNPLKVEPSEVYYQSQFSYWPFARGEEAPMSEKSIEGVSFALETFPQTRPAVAFVEREIGGPVESGELVVTRLVGGTWERLPPPRAMDARANRPELPRLEVNWKGDMVLAWLETDRASDMERIHVSRYDGTSWTLLGEPLDTQSRITQYKMVLDTNGYPVLVYLERELDLRVVRWSGSAWQFLGDPLSGNPGIVSRAESAAIAVDVMSVVVAWSETPPGKDSPHVFVMEFREGSWKSVGTPFRGLPGGRAGKVAVAMRSAADSPVVAWIESSSNLEDETLFISSWKVTSTTLGWTPPEQLQGMTQYHHSLGVPWLVIGAGQEPWVAWQRRDSASTSVIYRKHRSTGWEPEQFVAGTMLYGFQLDEKSFPWVAVGYPHEEAILRPQ
ncbi:Ig-like domain-containing protein [Pyxidicoccus sp. MSG2]|uniref:Ig-like domain-containing protein n=1 Tax=Pyxidicoccus sp. MSG2 TaxID=2996790 RepID=UPI00226DD104|nr:Ig-like domain-containing protein [Pyxidicoccus sp. MSG2]MCY1018491.1 Ig-like domain-containing protein [Pyxidicoccus sp. MSG2]